MRKTITILIILSANIIYSQVPNYVPTNGLVGWWPFNGNANDESGNGNNGTVNGAALTLDRFNNTNSAYNFDGVDDFISAPKNTIFVSGITFNSWVYLNTTSGVQSFFESWGPSLTDRTFTLYGENGLRASIQTLNGQKFAISSTLPNISEWYMLTGSFNGSELKIFLNSQLIQSTSTTNTAFNQLQYGFYSFGRQIPSIQFFNGKLDDIGIWNRALTQTEITALYTSVLSSETFTNTSSFQMYPNPANDFMQFKSTEMVEKISIYNALGQLIQENKTKSLEGAISIEHLAHGSYFVKVNNQNTSYTLLKK
jgi:hypothetical protein